MVALFVRGNVFMGDINHSKQFPEKFLSSVATVVREKIKEMLNTKLKQTGHVRPCKIVADKDTTKHRTRQLICLTTVFPEADDFIQTVYVSHPLIRYHKTEDVAQNVVRSVKEYISDASYAGCSLDGAYFHAKKNVPHHINDAFNVEDTEVHSDHDPLHRSGLSEKRARQKGRSTWVNDIGKFIATAFKDHNYGKKYEELREMAELMGLPFSEPKFHSETRFANSSSRVFDSAFKDLDALIENYKKTVDENIDSNLQESRDKANHAAEMLRKLNNKKFQLGLSALCDIYSKFSQMVCELQKVNSLPYERFENYKRVLNKIKQMLETLCDHSKCESQDCHWPKYHTEKVRILHSQMLSDERDVPN